MSMKLKGPRPRCTVDPEIPCWRCESCSDRRGAELAEYDAWYEEQCRRDPVWQPWDREAYWQPLLEEV